MRARGMALAMRAVLAACAAAGLGGVGGAGGAAAQSPTPAPGSSGGPAATVLTLRDALDRAAEFNPQYRQAVNRMELEGPQRRQAWGAFLPSLNGSFSTGQSFRRETTAVDFFGNPIDNEAAGIVTSSSSSQYASLSMDLFRGGARFHEFSRAREQARVDRLSAARDLNGILAEVQRQFLAALRHELRLAVEEELLAARERDYEVSRRLFELASVGRSDLLGAQLELEGQRVTVTQYRGLAAQGLLALRKAIGDPSLHVFELERQVPEPFDPATLDLEGLVEQALAENPVVAAAAAARSVRQSQLSAARAARWPTISLSSSAYRQSYGLARSQLFNFNPDDFTGSFGLSVSIPVFQNFRTTGQIASANVELRNAGEELRAAELNLEEQVRARYVDLQTAWANVRQRGTALEVASERLRIVREEYRLATKSIEELRAAIRDEAWARRDAVDQDFAFADALVGLYEAAGAVAAEAGLMPAGARD